MAPSCGAIDPDAPIAITSPVAGARYVLEPYRPRALQRPPLAAVPADPHARWTIDGEPAETWVPTSGEHRVAVARGGARDEVTITYE
jgi:hypothetical protein